MSMLGQIWTYFEPIWNLSCKTLQVSSILICDSIILNFAYVEDRINTKRPMVIFSFNEAQFWKYLLIFSIFRNSARLPLSAELHVSVITSWVLGQTKKKSAWMVFRWYLFMTDLWNQGIYLFLWFSLLSGAFLPDHR